MDIEKNLQRIKEIFLANDIDSETKEDNLQKIREWESSLSSNQDHLSWQENEITKKIIRLAKESYVEISLRLANDRTIDEKTRMSLWAKQDACLWIISVGIGNAKEEIKRIEYEIKTALDNNATN